MEALRSLFAAAILILFSISIATGPMIQAQTRTHGKALILSTLERTAPMGVAKDIMYYLTKIGYTVTFINDTAVTLNILTTQLNNYDIVIWRTNTYVQLHTTYWLVGDSVNPDTLETYARDFADGLIDSSRGMLGVSMDFFNNHFKPGSLENVKLAIIESSLSVTIARVWIQAGARATVDNYGNLPGAGVPDFYMPDYVTKTIVADLANGATVKNAVVRVSSSFIEDLNAGEWIYLPQFWYLGDGTTKIT